MEKWGNRGNLGTSIERQKRVTRNTREHPALKEAWDVHFATFVLVGESGTGKTSVADMMVAIYKKPKIFKVGQVLRAETNTQDEVEYINRPVADDKYFDDEQIRIIKQSTPDEPWIIEARLAGYWASKHREENEFPIIRIKLTAKDEVRYKRIQKRLEKNGEHLPIEEIQEKEKERTKRDQAQWTKAHPELIGVDPYDERLVDFTIDTTDLSVVQVFDEIHKGLVKLNLVKLSRKDEEKEFLPKSGTVFDAGNPFPPPSA